MSWKHERDSLIAQTLAFVQSVAGKREEAGRPGAVFARSPEAEMPEPLFAAQPRRVELPKAIDNTIGKTVEFQTPPVVGPPRPFVPGDMAAEIRARVASFRAHQQRFNREREEYFAATLAKLRTAIKDPPPRPRD
jgi:hypothetical protein